MVTDKLIDKLDHRQADTLYLTRIHLVWALWPMKGPQSIHMTADIDDPNQVDQLIYEYNRSTGGDFTADEIIRRYNQAVELTRRGHR
jgi:hypothetical protein